MATSSRTRNNVYTSLCKYVEATNPKLYQLFELCDDLRLLSSMPRGGMTLLLPSPKAVEKIQGMMESNDATLIGLGCNILRAHLLNRVIPANVPITAEQIKDYQLPSHPIAVAISNANQITITLGGTSYTLDYVPVTFASRDVTVWKYQDSVTDPVYDTAPVAPRSENIRSRRVVDKVPEDAADGSRKRRTRKGVDGGFLPGEDLKSQVRFSVAVTAENEFVYRASASASADARNVYLSYISSFAQFMHLKHKETFYEIILPLITFRATDFYAIFEPHRVANHTEYCVADNLIAEWWSTGVKPSAVDVKAFHRFIDKCFADAPSAPGAPAIYDAQARAKLFEIADTKRQTIMQVTANSMIAMIQKEYTDLAKSNTLGAVANVFPASLADAYAVAPWLKFAQDEIANSVDPILEDFIENPSKFNMQDYIRAIGLIGNLYHASDEERDGARVLCSTAKLAHNARAITSELKHFLNSTNFLHIPAPSSEYDTSKFPINNTTEHNGDFDLLFNSDARLNAQHVMLYRANPSGGLDALILLARAVKDGDINPDAAKVINDMLNKLEPRA